MRLFELLIILINMPFFAWGFLGKPRPKWVNWLPLTAVSLLILHLFIEGGRWQMFPAYGLVVLGLIMAIRLVLGDDQNGHKPKRRIVTVLGLFLTVILFAAAVGLPTLLPVPQLIPTTGRYNVGTTTVHLIDAERPEIYTEDVGDHRELMVQIWYPADSAATKPAADYIEGLDIAGAVIAEQFDLPAFLFNHINLTTLNIVRDAPSVANRQFGESFPIIFFSHGLTGLRVQNTGMVRELASHGYIVVAADHTFGNALSVFPDGRVILYDSARVFNDDSTPPKTSNTLVGVWADDIGFMLDQLAEWNDEAGGRFNGRLDLTQVGIFGHSTGGGTAVEFCMQDDRCDAGIGLDSWIEPVSDTIYKTGLSQPFMFINSPAWLNDNNSTLGRTIFDDLSNDGYLLTLANTAHFDFTDLPLFSPLTPQLGLSGSIDSKTSLTMQNEYILTFFNTYLKGEDGGALKRPSVYPELHIEQNR